jgi:hypothetical protein
MSTRYKDKINNKVGCQHWAKEKESGE